MYCNKAAKKASSHVLTPTGSSRGFTGKVQRKSQSVLYTVCVIVSAHEDGCINDDFLSIKRCFIRIFFNVDCFAYGGREKAVQFEDWLFYMRCVF